MTEIISAEETCRGVAEKPCRSCQSAMPLAANKCVKCSSVQNWERYLGLSGSILGLLVALVSVSAFALPIVKNVLSGPPKAKPSLSVVSNYSERELAVAVGNGGRSSAVIKYVIIDVETKVRSGVPIAKTVRMNFRARMDDIAPSERIIKPNEIKLYVMGMFPEDRDGVLASKEVRANLRGKDDLRCTVAAIFTGLDGGDVPYIANIRCSEIWLLLEGAAGE